MTNDPDPRTPRQDAPPPPPGDAWNSPPIDVDAPESIPPSVEPPFPVVGIGASAGGLDAVTQLLQPLPVDSGLAFVLVQHLDPMRESLLTELLSRVTPMLVQTAQDGLVVQPNQIYVGPSHADVVIAGGVLKLIPRSETRGLHMPIDTFFRTLVEDQGPRAVGVILSGAGSDGALGLQEIKERGGLTFVQDEQTAAFAGMPHSAIMHGPVDFIGAPADIARELMHVARHPYVAVPAVEQEMPQRLLDDREAWGLILKMLQRGTGINFTAYKPSTIQRRIMRRMALRNIAQLGAYAGYLEEHRDELEALYHDLLIKVTAFFRDPDSYQALKHVVFPRLVQDRPAQQPLRIWVPGCATGEEAYSLAICLLEFLDEHALQIPIRLFATDIDEIALAKARAGLYIENIALDVSAERLRRFFVKIDQHYQISPAIRELCVFARHNLYQDPPFPNLDLISCRNVLIYLDAATQRRVIPLFHYALQPNGMLTLGPAESIGTFSDLFAVTDSQRKIYAKKLTTVSTMVDFPTHTRRRNNRAIGIRQPPEAESPWPSVDVYREADRLLLQQYSPAAVLVNDQMDILQFRGDTDRYLRPASGKASLNLFRMAREGLLNALQGAVEHATRTGAQARQEGAMLREQDTWREVTVQVQPLALPPPTVPHYLVTFEEPAAPAIAASTQRRRQRAVQPAVEAGRINQLQQEMDATRLYLQALMEQHESSAEELKAANEEIISSNEELQSTNEELETAKEELQSMNEELLTTNDELRHRNVALAQANTDLNNLFSSANLPIIMVDNDTHIRRFTAVAETILPLIPADVGRPIGHLHLNIAIPELEALVLQVIDTGSSETREVQDREGHWYSLRICPYRTPERKIDGAVLLLIDIDSLKSLDRLTQLLDEVRSARDYAEAIVQTVQEAIVILDRELRVRTANQAFYQTFHMKPEETEGHSLYEINNHQWDIPRLRELLEQIIPLQTEVRDFDVDYASEDRGRRTMRFNARRLAQTTASEVLILLAIEDITEHRRAQEQIRGDLREKELLLRELHHRVKNNLQLVSSLLNLQSDAVQHPAVRRALEESQRRIRSMALVHEQLSTSSTLSPIDMRTYIQRLVRPLFEAYAPEGLIGLRLQIEDVPVALDTGIPCGLILTELISNALQHAFPAGGRGEVEVTWRAEGEDHILLAVRDTGIGMPPEMDLDHADSLGLSLVRALVEQLGGSLQVERVGGTTVTIRFARGER